MYADQHILLKNGDQITMDRQIKPVMINSTDGRYSWPANSLPGYDQRPVLAKQIDQFVSGIAGQLWEEIDRTGVGLHGTLRTEEFPPELIAKTTIISSGFNVTDCNLDSSVGYLAFKPGSAHLVQMIISPDGSPRANFIGRLQLNNLRLHCSVRFQYIRMKRLITVNWPLTMDRTNASSSEIAFDLVVGKRKKRDRSAFQMQTVRWLKPPKFRYTLLYPPELSMVGYYVQKNIAPKTMLKTNKLVDLFLKLYMKRKLELNSKNQERFEQLIEEAKETGNAQIVSKSFSYHSIVILFLIA